MGLYNDPRILQDNILNKRLNAFSTIVMAAALVGSLSFQALTVLKPQTDTNFSLINLAALLGMVVVTVGCLFCVVVLSQQVYLLNRIMTGGVSGFDLAKTLFAKDYRWVRHIGANAFFGSVPLFLISSTFMVFELISPSGKKRWVAWTSVGVIFGVCIFMMVAFIHQRRVFYEKLDFLWRMQEPIARGLVSAANGSSS